VGFGGFDGNSVVDIFKAKKAVELFEK